jgi:hypothetical protein
MRCPNCGTIISNPRTRGQQGLLHTIIQRYAHELGYDMDHAKMELKVLYGGYIELDELKNGIPQERGQLVDLHDYWPSYPHGSIAFAYSEASYSSEYETGFIQFVQKKCFEADVDIGDLL